MKHDPDLGRNAERASDAAPRAILPDPDQCNRCIMQEGDCSRLAFAEMPIINSYPDGISFVDCIQFEAS